jgi:RNA polymerase sigma-70 factor (ECF subfamily)
LNQAIGQLLPDDATIITMFYKGEQSLEEIAQVLGIEANTVKVKLFRARQRLKEKLERNLKHEVKELI